MEIMARMGTGSSWRTLAIIVSSLLAVAVAVDGEPAGAGHPTYHVSTVVPDHPGWYALLLDFGAERAKHVMAMASQAVWGVLDQDYPRTTKKYADVHLIVEIRNDDLAAEVVDNVIHVSAQFLQNQSVIGMMVPPMTVLLYHEMTHVWQWTGNLNNEHAWGLFEGMADYVAVVSPNVAQYRRCGDWTPSENPSWSEGYCQTMDFLRYCVMLRPNFLAAINEMMTINNFYADVFFFHLLGKFPQALWLDYLDYKQQRSHPHEQLHLQATTPKLFLTNNY